MDGPEARPPVLLIDTNLLLVLLVGAQDPRQIERFKRTNTYTAEDYDLLTGFISEFREIMVTPNVLTEVSNLAGQMAEPLRTRVFEGMGVFATQVTERYIPSRDAVEERDFPRLGLADMSVLLTARERIAVLTDDLALYLKLSALGIHAVNFNHVRATKT